MKDKNTFDRVGLEKKAQEGVTEFKMRFEQWQAEQQRGSVESKPSKPSVNR